MNLVELGVQPVLVTRLTAHSSRKISAAMIGIMTGNKLFFLRATKYVVVEQAKSKCRVDCCRTSSGIENMIKIARCDA